MTAAKQVKDSASTPKTSGCSQLQSELLGLLPVELHADLKKHLTKLERDDGFQRGHAMYHRVLLSLNQQREEGAKTERKEKKFKLLLKLMSKPG